MGCNCGSGGGTIAQRVNQSAFRAAGSPVGFDRDHPVLIGETNDELTRVRVLQPVHDLVVGRAVWVTGDQVADMLSSGAAADITNRAQKKRLFRVGAFTYTNEQEANRVSAAMGTPVVEIA